MGLHLVEPGGQPDEAVRVEGVDASAGVVGIGGDLDDAVRVEDAEVPAGRSRRCAEVGGDVTGAQWTVAEQFDDPATGGLGQSGERRVDLKIIKHSVDLQR